jgi:hypothetical protein
MIWANSSFSVLRQSQHRSRTPGDGRVNRQRFAGNDNRAVRMVQRSVHIELTCAFVQVSEALREPFEGVHSCRWVVSCFF